MSEGVFAYCAVKKCRLYLQVAFIAKCGVKMEEGKLATTCRNCNMPMKELSEDDRKQVREDPDFLRKKEEDQ